MDVNTNFWEFYEAYKTFSEVLSMAQFTITQGYAGSLVRELSGGRFALYTLKMKKGAKTNG